MTPPTPNEIRAARNAAGYTQTEAAALIDCTRDTWAKWEGGKREMHPAFFRLFRLLTGQEALEVLQTSASQRTKD